MNAKPSRHTTAADVLARSCLSLTADGIPDHVMQAAKIHILDAMGVALAASSLDEGQRLERSLRPIASGGRSSSIGFRRPMTAPYAALLNGTLVHSLEYDDTHTASVIHGSAVIMPAMLAAAEEHRSSGREALASFVAGWESLIRLGATAPGAFQAHGFQTTAVCGPFVAAAITARLAGLSPAAAANAIGIAGSQASGVFAFLSDGSTVKSLHPGWAAHAGSVAAFLAAGGMTGPHDVFEHRFGLYHVYAGTSGAQLRGQLETVGSNWELPRVSVKLFPCCHFIHSFLECVDDLVREHRVSAADIGSIECLVPVEEAPIICDPWDRKLAPTSGYEAKFSLPYCVSALLVESRVDIDTFSGRAPSAAVVEYAQRIRYAPVEGSGYPDRFPGSVRMSLRSGATLERSVQDVRGGAARPVSAEEVVAKFLANAQRRVLREAAQRLVERVMRLETLSDLGPITRELRSTSDSMTGEAAGAIAWR